MRLGPLQKPDKRWSCGPRRTCSDDEAVVSFTEGLSARGLDDERPRFAGEPPNRFYLSRRGEDNPGPPCGVRGRAQVEN